MAATRSAVFLALFVCISFAAQSSARAQGDAADFEYFEKRVRPLLAENCYSCHGADSRPLMGGLRLDVRKGLVKGGGRGALYVPGQPDKSLLIRAVSYGDRSLQMPPKGRLSDAQIAILADWVKRGGTISAVSAQSAAGTDMSARARHWAWRPIRRPGVPAVRQRSWVRNPIDAFVLAGLEAKSISPARPADRRTLIRRVTYDLTGLPPTPEEIHAFLADTKPNAYEMVVDRLLASPHYGERWGRHWLDLVRYAETDGHEWDMEKSGAWQYRDYVIRALNADVPYDKFVLEHLAGDLLPNPRLNPDDRFNESVLGTGFLFLGSAKHSPVDLQDDEAERIDNQIDVLGKAFLGMGVGCARCHDHKFDAISTRDYYALYGFLRGVRLQDAPVGKPLDRTLRAELETTQSNAVAALIKGGRDAAQRAFEPGARHWQSRLSAARTDPSAVLYPVAALSARSDLGTAELFARARAEVARALREQSDRASKASERVEWLTPGRSRTEWPGWSHTGDAFPDTASSTSTVHLKEYAASGRPSVLAPGFMDSGIVADSLSGTLRSPTFTIDRPTLIYHAAGKNARIRLIIDGYQRIRDPIYGRLAVDIDSPGEANWFTQDVRDWIGHRAYVEFVDPGPGFLALDAVGLTDGGPPPNAPNGLVLKVAEDTSVTSMGAFLAKLRALAGEMPVSVPNPISPDYLDHQDLLLWALRAAAPLPDAGREIAEIAARAARLDASITPVTPGIAATDGPGSNEYVHLRGNYRMVGQEAPRRFLEVCDRLPPVTESAGTGRLELARRILSSDDPLPVRVIVNRVWQHHFGAGIVRTPDDFGVMGERPTNPALLDWLAERFTAGVEYQGAGVGHRVSRVGKQIPSTPCTLHPTPYACSWSLKSLHRLMVLSNTYRMDSVGAPTADLRDPQNRLVHRMPVQRIEAECVRDALLTISGRLDPRPYGPPVMPFLNQFTPGRGAPASGPLDGEGRRSIYLSVRRNFLIPMFLAFDYPNPITTIGRRSVSNVPAQALTLLNNPFVVDQAQVWAKRALAKPGSPAARITRLYEDAFGRLPRADEMSAALAFLDSQSKLYASAEDPRAWTDLCHVLVNVKEFIFVR